MFRLVSIVMVIIGLAACVPIPVSREYVTTPDLVVSIRDAAGQPVPAAELLLVRQRVPDRTAMTSVHTPNADGDVIVTQTRARETVFPLMMHGVHQYTWTWCATAPGHDAVTGTLTGDPSTAFRARAVLTPGVDMACRTQWERATAVPIDEG